jgi:dTDP-glucose 4,6-dehydratase
MKILVLGGTRFIGYTLVHELLNQGHEVTILNRGVTEASIPSGVERVQADRDDADSVIQALKNRSFDAAFDISAYTAEQLQGSLDALTGKVGHYVFTSTTAVYFGNLIYPIHEHDRVMPDERGGLYGWNKILAERALRMWSQNTGIPFSVIRPSYVYGAGTNSLGREPAFFYRLEHERPLLLPTRGIPLAHLVHVEDIAQMFVRCLGNARSYGQIYNGAGPDYASLRGWFNAMAEVVGVAPKIVSVPDELTPAMRSFPYQTRRCVIYSIEKARRDLDYAPRWDTTSGLAQSYEWYKRDLSASFSLDLSEDDEILAKIKSMD